MPHSPGPWETSVNDKGQWDVCGPGGGDMIADLRYCDNAEANAPLLAAAPKLLDVAKLVHNMDGRLSEQAWWRQLVDQAEAAIAEADGKPC